MTPTPTIQEQIEAAALKRYPYIWPKNKDGEFIEQRVGQKNPPGSKKAKTIQGIFINGADFASSLYEPRIQELEKALMEAIKVVRHSRNVNFSISMGDLRSEGVEAEWQMEQILGKEKYSELCNQTFNKNTSRT